MGGIDGVVDEKFRQRQAGLFDPPDYTTRKLTRAVIVEMGIVLRFVCLAARVPAE